MPLVVPRESFVHQTGKQKTQLRKEQPASNGFDFVQVECGMTHTLLLNGQGEVFSFGEGLSGQLGTNVMVIQ